MIVLISFYHVHNLGSTHLAEGWKAEVSKGGFAPYSRGKRGPSEKPEHVEGEEDTGNSVEEEEEEDGEGRMLASCCHVLLMDAYAPIRSTTTWSAICSSGSASSFQRSIPF